MNKLDSKIINEVKYLSLDMIKKAGSGDTGICLASAHILYSLFSNHLKFDRHNPSWINRDRVIVSNRLLPLMYSMLHLTYGNPSLDNLMEYKQFNSLVSGVANRKLKGIEIGSIIDGDICSSSVGIALGERYLEELIKIEDSKNNVIDFHTYCICTEEDIMSGLSYEAMSYAACESLNKLIFIVIKDGISKDSATVETFNENLIDRFISLKYNVEEINDSLGNINGAIEEARFKKKPSAIIIKTVYGKGSTKEGSNQGYNKPLSDSEMKKLKEEWAVGNEYFTKDDYEYFIKSVDKRLNKDLAKWQELKQVSEKDLKIKQVLDFLETGKKTINFKPENIKIHDGYEEEIINSNSKIFNVFASKSPFILCGSDDNFIFTKSNIVKSSILHKDNPTGRNILFGSRTMGMGGIACGLAALGFKVFISTPLIHMNVLNGALLLSVQSELDVKFIFTQDTVLNNYEKVGYGAYNELNHLRTINGLVNLRPCDVDEVIGVYDIAANYHKPCTIIIGNEKIAKLKGTNYKYVMAGAYRVKKEKEMCNAILIASGSEVSLAMKIATELAAYGVDFRVVSIPATELFEIQNERYKNTLLPKEIPTFVLEFASSSNWHKYATSKEYILGVNTFVASGTKEELLKFYGLDIDGIKAKIMSILKK